MPEAIKRSFTIGEEWLYFKIYCGVKTANELLISVVEPLVTKLRKEKKITLWFFIRYSDPEHHLRIRLIPILMC
jgi:thiopeptide-type bacteriocin biosynthesis protein